MPTDTIVDSLTDAREVNTELLLVNKKYIANDVIVVTTTSNEVVTAGYSAFAPHANLSNRYYPTVAVYPNLGTNIVTKEEIGGYFLPQKLGASVYLSKNLIYTIHTDRVTTGSIYNVIAPEKYNKGRGLTKTDQQSIVTHKENNNWLKAINVSDQFDGSIIGGSTYQKFIPYQSSYESKRSSSDGVVTPVDNFEYWTGPKKDRWLETGESNKLNELKYFNISQRNSDLLVTPNQDLYAWFTDVFGNQYSLYKNNLVSGGLYYKSKLPGTLWVKTIDSTTTTGPSALNLIYKKYKNTPVTYSQLFTNNILNIEVFFDVIIIELTNAIIYEKITFNYDNYTIEPTSQNYLPVNLGVTTSAALSTQTIRSTYGIPNDNSMTWFAGNWYDDEKKTITICTLLSSTLSGSSTSVIQTSGISALFVPVLYRIDLNNPSERIRLFPKYDTDFTEYVYAINSTTEVATPVFTYNKDTNAHIVSFLKFTDNNINLISYKLTV